MIVIIDYGTGNLNSVQNGFARAGFSTVISGEAKEIETADGLVLPGVGAFATAMDNLKNSGLDRLVLAQVKKGTPLLGICVGLQLLFDSSEEMGRHPGLGLIPGDVLLFRGELKVPQIGWNQLKIKQEHPLLDGISDGDYFYFVHSYYARPANEKAVLATADYGVDFAAVVRKDNVFGIQFHPEKSSSLGLKILENFGRLVQC